MAFEGAFVDSLTDDELRAVVAHELGHVWIFTHHPYLQTEQLANKIALRVVTRETLERVYDKVWPQGAPLGAPDSLPRRRAIASGSREGATLPAGSPDARCTAPRTSRSVGNPPESFFATSVSPTHTVYSPRLPSTSDASWPVVSLMSAAARAARGR